VGKSLESIFDRGIDFSHITRQGNRMSKIKSRFFNFINQLSKIWKAIAIGIFLSLAGAAFTVLVARWTNTPVWKLTKDAASVIWQPAYIGLLSDWDVVLWIATASICLFSAVILYQQKAPRATFGFFLTSGIFTLILGLDDLYMLHERVLPKVFHMPEIFFYLLYFLAIVAYLIYFKRRLAKYENLLFTTSIFLFIISRMFFIRLPFIDRHASGDVLKYFGIVFWMIFFYRTALHEVNAVLGSKAMQNPASLTSD
jgi:ABC-type multidrug transport system fused ATPase/permease subunit